MHLRVTLERLQRRFGIKAQTGKRQIPYKETIRKSVEIRGRHKKQSGGHGQFGDVVVEISPQPRGLGFSFSEVITGGAVPRNYFPAVEAGVRDYLPAGPLGFPVVDVAVVLKDGSYHTVNSSEMAFRTAGRIAMSEGMPKCSPVLLEPISLVKIAVPSEATPKVNGMISSRRGQNPGLRRAPWLGRLGRDRGAHPRGRDPRPDYRASVGDGGRWQLRGEVRPSRGRDRQARRADRGGPRGVEGGLGDAPHPFGAAA